MHISDKLISATYNGDIRIAICNFNKLKNLSWWHQYFWQRYLQHFYFREKESFKSILELLSLEKIIQIENYMYQLSIWSWAPKLYGPRAVALPALPPRQSCLDKAIPTLGVHRWCLYCHISKIPPIPPLEHLQQ